MGTVFSPFKYNWVQWNTVCCAQWIISLKNTCTGTAEYLGTVGIYLSQLLQKIVSLDICTLYNDILRIARNLVETKENIKIESHSFHHIICDWFLLGWSRIFFFWKKKNPKWPIFKMAVFQNRQFSKFFCENFMDWSLG